MKTKVHNCRWRRYSSITCFSIHTHNVPARVVHTSPRRASVSPELYKDRGPPVSRFSRTPSSTNNIILLYLPGLCVAIADKIPYRYKLIKFLIKFVQIHSKLYKIPYFFVQISLVIAHRQTCRATTTRPNRPPGTIRTCLAVW